VADPTEPVQEPVREDYEIKTEIDEAQQNLEQNLGELKDAILEKVDVKAHIEQAIDDGKEHVVEAAVRAREGVIEMFGEARRFVRENPLLVAGIVGGIALVAGAAFAARRSIIDARD